MDKLLSKLIAEVLQAPEGSSERRKAMHRFLIELQKLPGLARSSHPDYLEALNKTWLWVSRNIEAFAPRKDSIQESLVNWINGYLRRRIQDLYSTNQSTDIRLDEQLSSSETGQTRLEQLSSYNLAIPGLSGLEDFIAKEQEQQKQRLGLKVKEYIKQDPEVTLQTCHPKSYPHCNCQVLSLRLLVKEPPDSFTILAKELDVKYQSLVTHWKRKCLPLLQETAKNLGYQQEQ